MGMCEGCLHTSVCRLTAENAELLNAYSNAAELLKPKGFTATVICTNYLKQSKVLKNEQ